MKLAAMGRRREGEEAYIQNRPVNLLMVIHRKGKLNPISVAIKMRQGRKAVTLITGFEPFLVNADELGEELRKLCAAQTSGTSFPPFSIVRQLFYFSKQ